MEKKFNLTNEEISSICRSLELMLHSGIDFADALFLLSEDEEDPQLKEVFRQMGEKLQEGQPLAQVVTESGCFPDYVCSLLQVGEVSGRTEKALGSLASHYDRQASVNRHLKTALFYPAVLLIIMLAVIVILLVYVLPIFNDVYTQLGSSLSGIAGGLLSLGKSLGKAMPVFCVVVGIIAVGLIGFSASTSFRDKCFAFFRKHWGHKGVSAKLNTARFAEAIAMGLASGLPSEDAVSQASFILEGIPSAQTHCEACAKQLEQGENLAVALGKEELITRSECRLLEIALRSGSADDTMEQIAQKLSDEGEEALEATIGKVEPALVLVCCILVGLILMSVMLPLMNIMAVIG